MENQNETRSPQVLFTACPCRYFGRAQTPANVNSCVAVEWRGLATAGGTLSLYELAASTSSSRLDLYGEKVNMDLSGETKPPFSRLLNQACEFADKTDATIFDSEILKSIVQ